MWLRFNPRRCRSPARASNGCCLSLCHAGCKARGLASGETAQQRLVPHGYTLNVINTVTFRAFIYQSHVAQGKPLSRGEIDAARDPVAVQSMR